MPQLRHFYLLGVASCAIVGPSEEDLLWRDYCQIELEKALVFSGRGQVEGALWWFNTGFAIAGVQTSPEDGAVLLEGKLSLHFYSWSQEEGLLRDQHALRELRARVKFRRAGEGWFPESLWVPWCPSGLLDSVKLGDATLLPGEPVAYFQLPKPGERVEVRVYGSGKIHYLTTWDARGNRRGGVFSGDTALELGEFLALAALDTATALGLDFKLEPVALSLRRPKW